MILQREYVGSWSSSWGCVLSLKPFVFCLPGTLSSAVLLIRQPLETLVQLLAQRVGLLGDAGLSCIRLLRLGLLRHTIDRHKTSHSLVNQAEEMK